MRKLLAAVAVVFLAAGAAQAQQDQGASPTMEKLKEIGFDEAMLAKAEPIVKEYSPKIKDAADKAKDAADKKAAYTEVRAMKTEEMNKLYEICGGKDSDLGKKLAEAYPGRKKKNAN
jgi:hypothetical protein